MSFELNWIIFNQIFKYISEDVSLVKFYGGIKLFYCIKNKWYKNNELATNKITFLKACFNSLNDLKLIHNFGYVFL